MPMILIISMISYQDRVQNNKIRESKFRVFFQLKIDHHLQYANKTDSFISITAENRSNAIAALLERVYHIEMMNLYMHVARDLFTIAKSPIPNEDCIIALARIGGLYHKESSKLLHACHDIGNGHSRFRSQIEIS